MDEMEKVMTANEMKPIIKAPLKARVVNAVFWLGATKIFGQAISWFITIYVARLLQPGDYGLMSMAGVFIGLILLFNEVGLGAAIVQRETITREDLSNIFWVVILLNAALYLISFTLAPFIAVFFNEPRVVSIMRVIAINFMISGIGLVPYQMLSREMTFSKRSVAEFIGNLSGGIATLLFALKGAGVWSLVYGALAVSAVTNLLYCVFYPWKPTFSFAPSRIKGMINFGAKVAGARLMWYTYSNADYLIAGKLLGKSALGYYTLAFQFASVPLEKIVSLYTQIAFPAFSEIQNDTERLKKYFLKSVNLIAFITFPLFMLLFLTSNDAVNSLLTPKWGPIILPLKILCVVSTLRAVNALNIPLVLARGRSGLAMLLNLIAAIVMPIAFYIGSFYGLEGFSYSWLFAFPALFVIITYISIKQIGLGLLEYLMELRHACVAAVFMVVLVLFLQQIVWTGLSGPVRFAASCVIGVVSYCMYFLIFNRAIFSEVRSILKR